MSKRNVAYVKPQEPNFLRRLKEEIGYKEGPTVETKRQRIENDDYDSDSAGEGAAGASEGCRDDEKPQVVVLEAGDLTAEQAEAERLRIEKEEKEKPADLNQRIIFKAKHKVKDTIITDSAKEEEVSKIEVSNERKDKKSKKSRKIEKITKLSFNQDDEEEEEN